MDEVKDIIAISSEMEHSVTVTLTNLPQSEKVYLSEATLMDSSGHTY